MRNSNLQLSALLSCSQFLPSFNLFLVFFLGTFKVMMNPQTIPSLLLVLLLAILGLGLIKPSYGQDPRYQRFLLQHVDSQNRGGTNTYCNTMMKRRGMATSFNCKRFNTFIHDNASNIDTICRAKNVRCKNGQMNCHGGMRRVTDCALTSSSRPPNCRYQARGHSRNIVIACDGNPYLPVHFDR